jgi:aminoglycoside phosphotransferase (APT) family kinase protein
VDGSWVVGGWAGWTALDGEPAPLARWPELVAASRAFHAALVGVPPPGWVGRGRNRWAVAERVAWDGAHVDVAPELADLVDALRAAGRPVRLPDQLVHGDIAGNVLFAAGQPPAVIDFSPSWRPAGYALAVAAVDLLTWSRAPADILDELADEDGIDQLLLRALVWRLVTESLGRSDAESLRAVRAANEPVVDLVLSRVSDRSVTDLGAEFGLLRPVGGGHSRARTLLAERADGETVFVKSAHAGLDVEFAVYDALDGNPFLARRLAATREPVPMLVLEALDPGGWVRDWTPGLIEATRALLDRVHALPAPLGVPLLGAMANPWEAIAAEPDRLLRMCACSAEWLSDHLDILRTAAAAAPTSGGCLIHRDVRRANLWHRDGRLVLVDWGSAAIGDPWLDHHLWLVALHAEGGPTPEMGQGPHAAGHAALIAGVQPSLTPARDADPELFALRRRLLTVALAWAARLLGLPPPAHGHGTSAEW